MAKAIARELPAAAQRFKDLTSAPVDKATLYGLITRYLAPLPQEPDKPPPHLRKMAERTLRDHRTFLDRARTEIGHLEVVALRAPGARKVLLTWRDGKAATPKTADELLYALSRVFQWAKDEGEIAANPLADFPRIYSVDRSEIIWTPEQLEILFKHAEKPFADFVQLATMTGVRLADLRKLPRSAVGADAIVFQTGKSGKKRTAVVPIIDALRPVLKAIPHSDKSLTLLNSSRGRPWSEPGLESAIQRARRDALKAAKERGLEASGLEGLRIHDMRGTACTMFMRDGMDDEQIATVMGWKLDQVKEIRRRYVSGQEIGLAMLRRIRENKARAESVKPNVK